MPIVALAALASPASATWSILIVDTATGEVAVGIATCLTGFDLRPSTVVVVPEHGVAAAQSFVGPLSLRRMIRAELLAGTSPAQILALLAAADPGHQGRQYGIVDVAGGATTFTGANAGAFANGLTGQVGTLVYSIQGNVLTGQPVLTNAEQALRNSPGDVGLRLMAAMEAARAAGGDGRCSCSGSNPTGCGSPPANFTKSAHIGLVIVSRPGDVDAVCGAALGCAAGSYYLDLNVANQQASAVDPVLQLQQLYQAWRTQQVGRPDHFQSSAQLARSSLRGDGADQTTVNVLVRDLQGGAPGPNVTLRARLRPGSTATDVRFGAVRAMGGGAFQVDVIGGNVPGRAELEILASDGLGPDVLVAPRPVLTVLSPLAGCGDGTVDDGFGGRLDVLRVDGSAGQDRIVDVGFGQPFSIELTALPSAGGLVGASLVWLHLGVPGPAAAFPVLPSDGTLCFTPAPFAAAPTLLAADSFGLGGAYSVPAAPWTIHVPGIPALTEFTLQGVLVEAAPAELATTNAVLVRMLPLPAPAVTDVVPRATLPGALVTITGQNFAAGVQVLDRGAPLPLVTATPNALSFSMPAGVACGSSVRVQNLDGQFVDAPLNPDPVIFSTPITTGPAAGGGTYIVSGAFLRDVSVSFGGSPATLLTQADNVLIAVPPGGSPGAVQVRLTNPAGCSATATYTYQ